MLCVFCASCGPKSVPEVAYKPKYTDQESVVNTVVAGFFETNAWSSDWQTGDYVVIEPKWSSEVVKNNAVPMRTSMTEALNYWIGQYAKEGNSEAESKLKQFQADVEQEKNSKTKFTPAAYKPLQELNLDNRVVVASLSEFGDTPTPSEWVPGDYKTKNREGREGTVRVRGRLGIPYFSQGGGFSYVRMDNVPFGSRKGDLHFFLQRMGSGWEVVSVGKLLYP